MSGNGNGNGGQLVSQLMQEINSGGPMDEQDYTPQMQQVTPNFNPELMVPPPHEDDVDTTNEQLLHEEHSDDDDEDEDEEEEYYYKENNLSDALSQFGGEYTSFMMDLLKNSVIIFIGYIIFSHPILNNYIMQFGSIIPGLNGLLNIPTYNLAVKGILFVIFYFIISYFV